MYRLIGVEYIEPNIKRETYKDFPEEVKSDLFFRQHNKHEEESMPKHISKNPAYKPNYKMNIEIITGKSHIKMRDLEPGDWFTTDGVTGPPLMKLNPVNLGIFSCVGLEGNLYNVGGERVVCPLRSTVPHCMEHADAC